MLVPGISAVGQGLWLANLEQMLLSDDAAPPNVDLASSNNDMPPSTPFAHALSASFALGTLHNTHNKFALDTMERDALAAAMNPCLSFTRRALC
jgi:hypothetical protein